METATMNKTSALIDKAHALMEEHGLTDIGWRIDFNNAKSTAGTCDYSKKTIFLSRFYLKHNDVSTTWNTITHEVAHALVGPGHGHGRVWRTQHIRLGGSGDRTLSLEGKAKEEYIRSSKWTGTCPKNPEHTFARNRLTQTARSGSCSRCSSTFSEELVIEWTKNY